MNKWLLRAKTEISKLSSYQTYIADKGDAENIAPQNTSGTLLGVNPLSVLTVIEKGGSYSISESQDSGMQLRTKKWDADMKELILWFESKPKIPQEPFFLKQGVQICDYSKFCDSIKSDILMGPSGPRSLFGALKNDLFHLRNVVLFEI